MPGSDNITVPYISGIVSSLSPCSALDIGIGMGKFGFIFREACEWTHVIQEGVQRVSKEKWQSRLDGIEVCSGYITPLQEYLYDKIYIGPAQEIVSRLGNYDLIYLGDVIEHFEKSDGQRLLDVLFEKARLGVLIVTPVGEYKQDGIEGNQYEEHRSIWSPADLRRFPYVRARKPAKRQWVIFVGQNKCWIPDPLADRKSHAQLVKRGVRRQKLKKVVNSLFGEKGLNLLLKIKRYHEG